MQPPRAYTSEQFIRAVNLSVLLGWAGVALPLAIGLSQGYIATFFGMLAAAALFGLPIAFVITWVIAGPILYWVMRKPVSWTKAVVWATIISIGLSGLGVVLISQTGGQVGYGEKLQYAEGVITPYGWQKIGERAGMFILFCVFIAIAIRAIIGPAQKAEDR